MLSISSIEAKYKRANLMVTNTFLFSELDEMRRGFILKQLKLNIDERLIIYYFRSIDYSWLLSNQRIIIFHNSIISSFPYNCIQKVQFPEIGALKKSKREIDKINILLVNGEVLNLFTENTSWHFVYEILKYLMPD